MSAQSEYRLLKRMLRGKFAITLRDAREALLDVNMKITDRRLQEALKR